VEVIGGTGNDTLIGPHENATWQITGENSGSVAGIAFSGVENLTGAAGNADTFVFDAAGSISGLVDGGIGGFDSIVLDGGTYSSVVYHATGPDSGAIMRDGDIITYAGMEPVSDNLDADNRIIVVDNANHDDQIIISTNAGQLHIASGNSLFESIDIGSAPNVMLEIQADGGSDTFVFQSAPSAFNTKLKSLAGSVLTPCRPPRTQASPLCPTNCRLVRSRLHWIQSSMLT